MHLVQDDLPLSVQIERGYDGEQSCREGLRGTGGQEKGYKLAMQPGLHQEKDDHQIERNYSVTLFW